jgi:Ca2+-binding RTX toxin-like protein
MGIPGVNAAVDEYNQKVAKYAKVNMTRVRVAGMYDIYVMGSTPITIAIDSGAGNDTISVAPNVNDKTSILGGKGNDMLISGKMHTYLAGGAGNDVLVSRSKHGGTLDGGPGNDTFDSRFGSTLVADPGASDLVDIHGQSYPMATAASSSNVSMKNTTFSQIFVTPDGLV